MTEPLALAGATAGDVIYATARRQSDGRIWSFVAGDWVAAAANGWPDYAAALAPEEGGYWRAGFPEAWAGDAVDLVYQIQAGSEPASTDSVAGAESRGLPPVDVRDDIEIRINETQS